MGIKNKALVFIMAGLALAGCHRSRTAKTVSAEGLETSDWAKKRKQGVDFTASGTGPQWVLDMDFTKEMRFQGADGAVLSMPIPKSQPNSQGTGGILFNAKGNKLRVAIEPVAFHDKVSGRTLAYTVRVDARGQHYSGGGAFLNGASRLNSTWVLETYRGQRFHAGQFANRQLPFIEIKWKEKHLGGSTGCSRIQGNVQADADNVRFEALTTSDAGCAPAKFESGFVQALKSVTLYRISKNRLTLLADGQYVMTFRKEVATEIADGPHQR